MAGVQGKRVLPPKGTAQPCGHDIVLYGFPVSLYARMVRLQLAEKGLPYQSRTLNMMKGENLEPWYAELNPEMLIPTITIKAKKAASDEKPKVVYDSKKILNHLENNFDEGTDLVPRRRGEVWSFVDKVYSVEMAALFVGYYAKRSPAMLHMMTGPMHDKNLKAINAYALKSPELKNVYEKKKKSMAKKRDMYMDHTKAYNSAKKSLDSLLDKAEQNLNKSDGDFLFGSSYTVADVAFTVLACSLRTCDLFSTENRPNLAKYWSTVSKRPSYKSADLSDKIPLVMQMMLVPLSMFYKVSTALESAKEKFLQKLKPGNAPSMAAEK